MFATSSMLIEDTYLLFPTFYGKQVANITNNVKKYCYESPYKSIESKTTTRYVKIQNLETKGTPNDSNSLYFFSLEIFTFVITAFNQKLIRHLHFNNTSIKQV